MLDEPTNHLDAESVDWLEQHLKQYKGTVIAVTHDRYFLDNVAGWILELDRGEGIPWKGNYSSWLDQKQKRLAQEEKIRIKTTKGFGAGVGMGSHESERKAGKRKSALECVRKIIKSGNPREGRKTGIVYSARTTVGK